MSGEDEADIREACSRGHTATAVTLLLERYGPELLGYLSALFRDKRQAREAYCLLAEDLWRGLPGFEWRCSARVWAYTLARHARARYLKAERRHVAAEQALRDLPWLGQLLERTRSSTPLHLRSEIRNQFREISGQLSDEDQTLIMLRVDRRLSWRELAVVLGEVEGEPSPAEMARATARLRQRFVTVKEKLRELIEAECLLKPRDG